MTLFAGIDEGNFVIVQTLAKLIEPADGFGPPLMIEPQGPYTYHAIPARVRASSRPTPTCRLKWAEGAMVWVEQSSLANLKAAKIASINAERDRRIAEFDRFEFNGILFDGDARAEENIKRASRGAERGLPLPESFSWRAFDNSDVPMTNEEILQMELAQLQASNLHIYQMHGIARYLKDQVSLPETTAAELLLINWPEPEPE